ncbi:SUF system NifU family Fe-S cluster assembly protein [Candidatus Roizmanbacteria bacterium]|nr:SUF system NifU family Fe-S cluster assembly protein [Candidatus Roizmanbacteria bacterium]
MYEEVILSHYRNPHNKGTVSAPTSSVHKSNPLCGDSITLSIVESDGIITDIAFEGEGCVISTAAASLLTDYAKGKKKEDLMKLDASFIIDLLGIELGATRLKCALLPLEALQVVCNSL